MNEEEINKLINQRMAEIYGVPKWAPIVGKIIIGLGVVALILDILLSILK